MKQVGNNNINSEPTPREEVLFNLSNNVRGTYVSGGANGARVVVSKLRHTTDTRTSWSISR